MKEPLLVAWSSGKDSALGLPGNVDPCGENGEFHSFVFDFLSRTDLGGR
jgi:diphthamide synthase (EF-2-diphthine--ammonia ligase)